MISCQAVEIRQFGARSIAIGHPFALLVLLALLLLSKPLDCMAQSDIVLPKTVDSWTRPDTAQIIDASNIFEYMNGAGELYLAYGLDHLDVYEYSSTSEADILVEIYHMTTADDAFGLLSLDWGGEPIDYWKNRVPDSAVNRVPVARALYGAGLLRLCSGPVFARILAYAESEQSREAVQRLGKTIVSGQERIEEPAILSKFPLQIDSGWELKSERTAFFHSHLVLQSLYYLSHENILGLDPSTAGVSAVYERAGEEDSIDRVHVVVLEYESAELAGKGLEGFVTSYLPEHTDNPIADTVPRQLGSFPVEDGWLGFQITDQLLTLVFECPDQVTVETILNRISQ